MVILSLVLLGAFGGAGLAVLVVYYSIIHPMTKRFERLRYDGFRPEQPVEDRPKTVPIFKQARED
jgi:hypothetical protein